jgi:hypothetical protein
MKGERGERWRDLCSQAAEEQDPDRLMELVREINALLRRERAKTQTRKKRRQGSRSRRMNLEAFESFTRQRAAVCRDSKARGSGRGETLAGRWRNPLLDFCPLPALTPNY